MLKSLEAFLSDFSQHAPLPVRFVVGFSGGLDSTVLLHALKQMAVPIHAVHVNHQLQSASNLWASHCEQLCRQWKIPFTALTTHVEEGGFGLEGQARLARYRAIFKWMTEQQFKVLLCAHHQDDQLETVLLQLLRGSGFRGVGGMRSVGPVGVDRHMYPDLLLARPLLQCNKTHLVEYAQLHQLEYVDDPSNSDTTIRRNWIRHHLLPDLQTHFPQSPAALLNLAHFFQAHYSNEDVDSHDELSALVAENKHLSLTAWRLLDESSQLNTIRLWLLDQGVRCGKSKLLEITRQLTINKGGLRQVSKGWAIQVSQQQAKLLINPAKDSDIEPD